MSDFRSPSATPFFRVSVFLYRLGQGLCLPLHLLFRLRCAGMEHLPRRGPCLLAANHISHFDPVLITVPSGRDIDYMASAEFFVQPFSRAVMRALNAFPIDRNRRDLSAEEMAAYCRKIAESLGE